ncbi:MAG TPA: hypothetical protein ENI64_10530 [Gammaproteobacteria bacterium]|nr:hypothetical protein [Gammaproteobacteria bacterium]
MTITSNYSNNMTKKSDTIKQYLKPGKNILAALLAMLLVTGCASSPKQEETDPAQETGNDTFDQARDAYQEFNYDKAITLLNTMAAQGDANAQYALGYMYYYGFGVVHDETIALEWIKKAAARGQTDAIIALDRVKVSAKSEWAKNERDRAEINPSTRPDQHTQLMMQAEAIIAEETTKSSAEEIPEQTAPADTSETPANNTTPGQDWVLRQDPDHFTIQVISGGNEERIKQYMKKNGLTMQSTLFELQRNDHATVYIGVHGIYPSLTEARQAVQSLPTEVQEAQPWIRSFKSIQATLRK